MNENNLSIQPGAVNEVTKQLDELANRMQHVMQTEKNNLSVVSSGNDEVSQRVAHTLNDVHASFTKASDEGNNEIHDIAATLRAHSGRIVDNDLAD
jgi:phage-related protein